MRFAYADPPYIGQAKKHYSEEGLCKEVNHKVLIGWLNAEFDGWALSCSSPSLRQILSYCPEDVRIAAWAKPFAIFKPNVNPGYTWEPVIFRGARKRERSEPTIKDHLSCNITLQKGLVGAKPAPFCKWVIDLLGVRDEDDLHDIFPGTGIMGRVRQKQFCIDGNQVPLFR